MYVLLAPRLRMSRAVPLLRLNAFMVLALAAVFYRMLSSLDGLTTVTSHTSSNVICECTILAE